MSYNLTFSTLIAFAYFFNTCFHLALALEFPGETLPTRLEIEIGSNANITCRMNLDMFEGEDSSSLYFIEDDTKNRVPQSDIVIINASTVVFMLRNAEEQDRSYTCMSGKNGIGITRVAVGTPPLEVQKFQCRADDYKSMTCNFTIPTNNIPVLYNLTYYVTSPFYQDMIFSNGTILHLIKYPSQHYIQICNVERYGTYALCKMSKENGQYKQHYEFYNFSLTGYNRLGIKRQNFWINHFESVIPPQPVLIQLAATNDSISFWWRMETHFYKSKGLRYEIRLRADKFAWTDYTDYSTRKNKTGYFLELHNLPYAYYNYTISLRIRVNSSQHDEDLWSKEFTQRFQTNDCLPDAPPATDISSFDLIDAIEPRLRLYWEQRPFYRENGANFQYNITQVRRDGFAVKTLPLTIDHTSAVFQWDRNHQYEFIIKSSNDVGYSMESSRILVPALNAKRISDYSPDWIRNIYHEPNRTYTLSWNPPAQQNELIDYTVFWCFSKRALSNECNNTIQFKHLSKHITKYTTETQLQEQTLNLAVSANYKNFTTGMHWAMCTADISSNLIKMEPQLKNDSLREIDVQWNLEYVCTSLLEGYNLTYCPVKNIESTVCLEESAKTIIIEKNAKNYFIRNLKPFTAYKIEIYMFSKLKVGKTSDPKIIQTRQEAPSPPRNLRFSNITSDSVWLYWLPPTDFNGIIKSYTVVENNEHHVLTCNEDADENPCKTDSDMKYKLELLSSYTNYTVYILANTVAASSPSNKVHFTTLVGIPSSPRDLRTLENNGTVLQWTQPNSTSDRVDFYEISIERWYKNDKQEENVYGVLKSTSCTIKIPTCIDQHQKHLIRVTAVTAAARNTEIDAKLLNKIHNDENNTAMAKYFTESDQLNCYNEELNVESQLRKWRKYHNTNEYVFYRSHGENGMPYGCAPTRENYFILIYIIGVACGILMGAVFIKCSYDKFQKMRNITAILPQGLIVAYPPRENDGYINGSSEHESEFYKRSKELDKNEHRRLLISDSGYFIGNSDVSAIGVSTPPITIGYANGFNSSENCYEAENLNSDDTTAYTIMKVGGKPNEAQTILEDNSGGYVPPSRLEDTTNERILMKPFTTMIHPQLPAFIPPENCYVKPNKFLYMPTQTFLTTSLSANSADINSSVMPNINSSGYIQTQAFSQKLFLLFAVLICGQIASAQVKQKGKCPDVKLMDKFDWKSFDGVWYEHARYDTDLETGQECVYGTYTHIDDKTFGVKISAVNASKQSVSSDVTCKIEGPGVFLAIFKSGTKRIDKILDTDYSSYAVLYTCDNVGAKHEERAWILTRDRNANAKIVDKAEKVLKGHGVSEKFLKVTRQKDCPAQI